MERTDLPHIHFGSMLLIVKASFQNVYFMKHNL